MIPQQSLGLQWKLAAIYLAVGVASSSMVAVGYYAGAAIGLLPGTAILAGVGIGLVSGLCGAVYGFLMVRTLKRRLWEAGELAGRIAQGDFAVRLSVAAPDEVGWLEAQLNRMASHLEQAMSELSRLAEQNRQLAEEAGRGAALEERARLARDLHDTVNQHLFVLAMRVAAVRRRMAQGMDNPEPLIEELSALEEIARQAHGETRNLILQLRPTTLEQQGLGPALAEYARSAGSREGWDVVVDIDQAVPVKGPLAEALFRVAQEALNNCSKHAGAHTVWVRLGFEEQAVTLTIRDDGVGFNTRAGVRPTAVGLVGMQERLSALGGTVRVRSTPDDGTEVLAVVPMQEGSEQP